MANAIQRIHSVFPFSVFLTFCFLGGSTSLKVSAPEKKERTTSSFSACLAVSLSLPSSSRRVTRAEELSLSMRSSSPFARSLDASSRSSDETFSARSRACLSSWAWDQMTIQAYV